MRKLLALFSVLANPALAQTPAGVINAPIYATGYISQVGGINVTTNIPPQPNHPTNLNIYTTDAISGTWTIKLPNPAFEGQMLSFNCGAAVNAISIVSSDGSSIDSSLPSSCSGNGGFVAQFDLRSNIWRSLGSGYSANFRPFTGVASQWPWQLSMDGTWTLKQPTIDDIGSLGTNVATALKSAVNGAAGVVTADGVATLSNKTFSDAALTSTTSGVAFNGAQTTDAFWSTSFTNTASVVGVVTGNRNGVIGAVKNNLPPSTLALPVGLIGYGVLDTGATGNQVFGAYGLAENNATAGTVVAAEFTARNNCGAPDTSLPPNEAIGTTTCVSQGLQVTSSGTYASSVGVQISKEGGSTVSFNTGEYIKDYNQYGLLVESQPTGTQTAIVAKGNGNGTIFRSITTGTFAASGVVYDTFDSAGNSRWKVTQDGTMTANNAGTGRSASFGLTDGYNANITSTGGGNINLITGTTTIAIVGLDTISFLKPVTRPAPVVTTASTYSVGVEPTVIAAGSASLTLTLPSASSYTGRVIRVLTRTAYTVISASSNVVPITGGAAGTAILAATAGKWAELQSDGTYWLIVGSN